MCCSSLCWGNKGRLSLSLQSHQAAVDNLREHGLCIIPSYFSPETVLKAGNAAVEDVEECVARLNQEKGISLLPHPPGADFEQYAAADNQFVRGHGDKFTLLHGQSMSKFSNDYAESIRHDASIVAVLEETCLPDKMGKEWIEERKSRNMLRRSSSLLKVKN